MLAGVFTARLNMNRTLIHAADVAETASEPSATANTRNSWKPQSLSQDHLNRSAELIESLRGQLILAPLTRGNNLPFRRLCAELGAAVTTSEMVFARHLLKGSSKERALLKRHRPTEKLYGVQIATNVIDEGVQAALLAVEEGADWIDLNCGCPIHEATRRGLGSALLRKPQKLARLVSGIAAQVPVPLTVKVRTGAAGEASINIEEVVAGHRDAGAAAVTIHGRTALQRYKRPSDWGIIERVARSTDIPIIGNGDVLTLYEAARRLQDHDCLAVMVGRGALIKPWIFEEVKNGRELNPTARDRVGVYRRLVSHMREHFGEDAMGRRKAFYFLPWHLGFFFRYRPLPERFFLESSLHQPLISTRWASVACAELGESVDGLDPLERLLRCENGAAHEAAANVLWDAGNDGEAVTALERLSIENVERWEVEFREGGGRGDDGQSEG